MAIKKIKKGILEDIEGKLIKKFYRTVDSISSFPHSDGLGELYWYELIIELENNHQYKLEEYAIEKWKSEKKLVAIEPSGYEKIVNAKITEVIKEKEFEGVYLKFENGFVVHHDTFFGSEFNIEQYDEVFTANGILK